MMTETEVAKRRLRIAVAVVGALIVVAMIVPNMMRARDYKRTILLMEQGTGYVRSSADTSEVVRLVGKPDKHYYQLPIVPRHRHFWEH